MDKKYFLDKIGSNFLIDNTPVVRWKLTRKERNYLYNLINSRIEELRVAKLDNFFKNEFRDKKIKQILN